MENNDKLIEKIEKKGVSKDLINTSKDYMKKLLLSMISQKASDLFITVGFPAAMKINGKLIPVSKDILKEEHTLAFTYSIMNEGQFDIFNNTNECNFAISIENLGRFRINVMKQQSKVAMVIRVINTKIPTIESLRLPNVLKNIIMEQRGLIIVVGATSSGKSTTLASMVGYRNQNSQGHIITIEDPIEFIHEHGKSIISQREIGVDTANWEIALKNTLRQSPDVIMIGEVRDRETMEYALTFAETGHLCLCTLHANNANQAIDRIINFFPEDRRAQILMDLSLNLRGIISQRLVPSLKTRGRVPSIEILLNTSYIQDLIMKGNVTQIKEAMTKDLGVLGMQTFNMSLFNLYEEGEITYEDALRFADSISDLKLEIKLKSKRIGRDGDSKSFSMLDN